MIPNLTEEIKAVREAHPSWSFHESWNFLETTRPALFVQSSAESNRIQAKLAPQLEREKWKTEARIEANARQLMAKDPRLPFGVALVRAREQHPGQATAGGMYLVTAQHAISLDSTLPASIQYMPAGRATIKPNVNGVPREITVNVTSGTAAKLQADLLKLLNENVRPFVDFDHEGRTAAAIPRRFFWQPGSGVMLELDWTGAGKAAISGRDYSYFSPCFLMSENGDPSGLPPSGAIGSLVNSPAFRSIKRIAARL